MANAGDTIRLARKHLDQFSSVLGSDEESRDAEASARLCLADAVKLYDAGDYEAAQRRALKSLAYSVGVFHPDYHRCR